jgi:hypothetical protein
VFLQLTPRILEDTVQFTKEKKSGLNVEIYAWCCGSSYTLDTGGYCSSKKEKNLG